MGGAVSSALPILIAGLFRLLRLSWTRLLGQSRYVRRIHFDIRGARRNFRLLLRLRRVQFHFAVDQPEVAVTAVESVGMTFVAEADRLDHVFQRQIDEADVSGVLTPPSIRG